MGVLVLLWGILYKIHPTRALKNHLIFVIMNNNDFTKKQFDAIYKGENMELSKSLEEKVYKAFIEQRFVGLVSYTDDEFHMLLDYTKQQSRAFAFGGGSFLHGNDEVIFATLVEIAKRWKSDEEEDTRFWGYVFDLVLDGWENPKLYKEFQDLIIGLEYQKKISLAHTAKKKIYYATIMMHAFAPDSSVNAFFELVYNIYKNDLDFNYVASDKEICNIATDSFCAVVNGLGENVKVKIGSNAYGIKVGLRCMASGQESRKYFIDLMDKVLQSIDSLFHGNDLAETDYISTLLLNWWAKKQLAEPTPHTSSHNTPVTTKQNITVKFVRKDAEVYLCIPPIRFARGEYPKLWLTIYINNQLVPLVSEEIFTRVGEITITSVKKEFPLKDLLHKTTNIDIRVEITENSKIIFNKTVKRDFILFDNEQELTGKIVKSGNYFVYATSIDSIQTPTAISTVAPNLYNIYPTDGEMLCSGTRQVFFVDELDSELTSNKVQLVGASSISKWVCSDRECSVFGNRINILIPDGTSINSLELRVNDNRTLLSEIGYVSENKYCIFDVTDLIPQRIPCELILYSHLKEKEEIRADIISIQNLRICFSRPFYYGDDDKTVRVSVGKQYRDLIWTTGDDAVSCEMCKGKLNITIPQIKWRIDFNEWNYQPLYDVVWYKDYFNNGSVLELQSPLENDAINLYGICDGRVQLISQNASAKFEIGKYIYTNEGCKTLIFFLSFDSSSERREICTLSTKEHFGQEPPLSVVDGKLRFIGDNCFICEKKTYFNIHIKLIGREDLTVKSTDLYDGFLPNVDEGIYWIKISAPASGLFTSDEKVLWENEFILGDKEKLKLSNLILKINPIYGIAGDSWKKFPAGYYLTNLVRDQQDDTYLAQLHHQSADGEHKDVCGFTECQVYIHSPIALSLYLKDSNGNYTVKFKCDSKCNLHSPQSDLTFAVTNYNFIEVKNV